jgi:hypothetical protein
MRKSKTKAGFRSLRVGIAVAATAAGVLAGTATAAFAATGTITETVILPTSGQTLHLVGSGLTTTADVGWFIPNSPGTCPSNLSGVSSIAGAIVGGTYSNNSNSATAQTVQTPTLTPGVWKVCTFVTSGGAFADSFGPVAVSQSGTVSPVSGPSGGTNTITLAEATAPADPTQAFVQGTTTVVFVAASTCMASNSSYGSPGSTLLVAPANVTVVTTARLAATVPSGVTSGNYASPYSVCAYNGTGTSSPLVAKADAAYTVGVTPTITSVTPSTGSPQGGGTVSIVGMNLGSATVTIGGSPVTKTVASSTSTNFVGVTSAHAVDGPVPVVVSIAGGGSATKAAAFTYSNGIVVSPNTSPNTKTKTDIDVQGVGFSALNFTTSTGLTPNDNNAHVYLVKGTYDPTKSGTAKTVGQTTECLRVMPVSDTELICSLYLNGVPLSTGRDITGTVAGTVLTATSGAFTLGDVGQTVTGPASVTAGTAIASITDATHAVLTKAPTANITSAVTLSLAPSRTFADTVLTSGSTTITSATGAFNSADIGRVVTGGTLPGGTTITAVTNATTATVSAPPTTSATTVSTVVLNNPGPVVPNGSYTVAVVANGGVDVQPGGTMADPAYLKSIISSGSTFTVADY